jgi:putative hydrolase of the HAD superfamily
MTTRAVIFDLDDTLYPHEGFVRSGLAAVARYTERRFGIHAEQALKTMLQSAGTGREFQSLLTAFDLPEDLAPALLDVFRTHEPSLWLFHDAAPTLQRLRHDGWSLAILTNGLPAVQARKVQALGVDPLVDLVVFAQEHAVMGKPHPDVFAHVLSALRLPADRCVMVGDDVECDIKGARAAGLRTIKMVRHDAGRPCPADAVLEFLSDVPAAAASLIPEVTTHAA